MKLEYYVVKEKGGDVKIASTSTRAEAEALISSIKGEHLYEIVEFTYEFERMPKPKEILLEIMEHLKNKYKGKQLEEVMSNEITRDIIKILRKK